MCEVFVELVAAGIVKYKSGFQFYEFGIKCFYLLKMVVIICVSFPEIPIVLFMGSGVKMTINWGVDFW